jgi:hypothetical protein
MFIGALPDARQDGQAEIMIRIAAGFGFTPASRGRISTTVIARTLFDLIESAPGEPTD